MAQMSVSGIVSGMDWESMIDEIITNAAKPAQPQVSKKTNLTNKKSLFEEMKTTMNSLQSSLSPLKLPSTYKAKTIDIERLDKNSSYKGVLTATVNADAEVNVWDVTVKQLASAQINRSKQITDSSLSSTLSGVSGNTIYVNAGGQKIGIEVKSSDTLESLKSRINTTLKTLESPIYVTASVVDNKLILKSDYTGLGTMTAKETFTYDYSGTNRLSNIAIPSGAIDNVKITSGNKSYTIHKDFEVANGNEIRWRRYDRSTEVALNDKANIKYTMTGGDVYEKSGTYGEEEVSVSEFKARDNGLLAARMKIEDTAGNKYTYGKDFTLDSAGKVKWIDEGTSSTNEPSSYKVGYDKTVSKNYSAEGVKINPLDVPASYTVSYDKTFTSRITASGATVDFQHPTSGASGNMPTYVEFRDTYGLSVAGTPQRIDFDASSNDKIEILESGSVGNYSYVTDFIIRKANYGTGSGSTNLPEWNNNAVIEWRSSNRPSSGEYTVKYTHTYSADNATSSGIGDVITAAGTDTANIKVVDSDGREYTQGVHYKIENGEIVWTTQSEVTDVTMSDFAELQTKYAEATGSELSTVTLIDGDGVLRTYVDPEDTSLFTMSSGGKDYVYGRDYVLRVNDAGNGYRFDWLIEGSNTITDASTTVATYAAYKNISTSSWTAAPTEGTDYKFGFSYDYTTPDSATVSSSATDKSLSTLLTNVTVDPSDYSNVKITSGSKTYEYGYDYTIDSTGTITWLEHPSNALTSYTAEYQFSSSPSFSQSVTASRINNSGQGYTNLAGLPSVPNFDQFSASMATVTGTADDGRHYYYISKEYGQAAFTLTTASGKVLEYGKDYALRSTTSNSTSGTVDVIYPKNSSWPWEDTKDSSAGRPSEGYTLAFNNTITKSTGTSSTGSIASTLGFSPVDGSKLTITSDNKTYTYVSDATALTDDTFTLVNGAVQTAQPKHPTGAYTIKYEFLKAENVAADATEVSIKAAGYGDINGDTLSYEQITTYAGSDALSNFFTLTDGTKTYEYGTDYKLVEGSEDSSSGKHNVKIEWIDGGSQPTSAYTLYLSGNEQLKTTVTRSASDTLSSVTFDDIDDGTVTITQGSKTFYEGVDFDLTKASDGSTIVNWIPDTEGGYEWYYPNPGSSYTINHTDDDGNTTTYTGRRNNYDSIDMAEKFYLTSVNGSISVQYGDGDSYKLDVDGAQGSGHDVIQYYYSVDVTKSGTSFDFRWLTPTQTTHSNLPSMNDELTLEYSYDANTFDLADDSDGNLLYALGFVKSDKTTYDDYTAAQDAELEVDGEKVYRDSNDIGADYENELIKGVTLHLKGLGEVSLDISHDAEKAVTSIQTFVDNYNDLMSWMNTRMTEKQLDEDAKATVDADDFRMRWGLLHGNSLLRNTKSQMRSLTSQNFTFSFTQRKSSEEIYGPMSFNGLRTSSTLRLRIGTKYVDVTIDPTDTLETIVNKINDDTKGGAMNDIYYDDNGEKLRTPLLKALVENDKLVIQSSNNDEITMSGSAAMNALKMNYTYKGLYQIGIESTSDDYGKSGELVFDESEFMEALEDNPDEVQALMLKFVGNFDTWVKSMLNSSASGQTSGTLTREIENIQSQIDNINEYLENYQDRLDRMEENLRTRYANTESQFSKLSQQANSIAAILNQLNGTASGGGYGQTSS